MDSKWFLVVAGMLVGATATYYTVKTPAPGYGVFEPGVALRTWGIGLNPGEIIQVYGCAPGAPCTIAVEAELMGSGCKFYQPKVALVKNVQRVTWTIQPASGASTGASAAEFRFREGRDFVKGEGAGFGIRIYDVVDYAALASAAGSGPVVAVPAIWRPGASAPNSVNWGIVDEFAMKIPKASGYDVYAEYRLLTDPKTGPFTPCPRYDPIIMNNGD